MRAARNLGRFTPERHRIRSLAQCGQTRRPRQDPSAAALQIQQCCLCRRPRRLKTFAPGWTHTTTPDGILTVTTPAGVTRTSRPPSRQLTGPRVLTRPPDESPRAPDPADDPAPF